MAGQHIRGLLDWEKQVAAAVQVGPLLMKGAAGRLAGSSCRQPASCCSTCSAHPLVAHPAQRLAAPSRQLHSCSSARSPVVSLYVSDFFLYDVVPQQASCTFLLLCLPDPAAPPAPPSCCLQCARACYEDFVQRFPDCVTEDVRKMEEQVGRHVAHSLA